jgi:hypothetical protein
VRLDAEDRLRNGKLKVLVRPASLELGIDIGHVDLVARSPRRTASRRSCNASAAPATDHGTPKAGFSRSRATT